MRDVIVGAGWAVGADAFIMAYCLCFYNKMTLLKKYLDGPTNVTRSVSGLASPPSPVWFNSRLSIETELRGPTPRLVSAGRGEANGCIGTIDQYLGGRGHGCCCLELEVVKKIWLAEILNKESRGCIL